MAKRLVKFRIRYKDKSVVYEWMDLQGWHHYYIELDVDDKGKILRTHNSSCDSEGVREQYIGETTDNDDKAKDKKEVYEGDTIIVGKCLFRENENDIPCYKGKVVWNDMGFCLQVTEILIDMTQYDVGQTPYLGEFNTIFEIVE